MSQAQKFYPSCRTRRRPAVALFITRISRGGYFSSLNLAPNLEALHLRCEGRQSEEQTPSRGYLVYQHLGLVLPKLSFGPTITAPRCSALPFASSADTSRYMPKLAAGMCANPRIK